MSRPMLPLFAALLLLTALRPAPAQTPTPTSALAYHWHSLVLQHTVPSMVLRQLHWQQDDLTPTAPRPAHLPEGVRRLFALQSNNSLLIEATDEGYAQIKQIVRALDVAPRQVQLAALFVAVSAARAKAYAQDMKAALLLPQLLNGEARINQPPTVTASEDQTISIPCGLPRDDGFRTIYTGAVPNDVHRAVGSGSWLSSPPAALLTPHFNPSGTVTLSLYYTTSSATKRPMMVRTLRSREMGVYEVTGLMDTEGERLFFFVTPTLIGESGDRSPTNATGGQSVTVTP